VYVYSLSPNKNSIRTAGANRNRVYLKVGTSQDQRKSKHALREKHQLWVFSTACEYFILCKKTRLTLFLDKQNSMHPIGTKEISCSIPKFAEILIVSST
jgi:hypothetical protein